MFCQHCGASNPNQSKFCTACGQALVTPGSETAGQGRTSRPAPKRGRRTGVFLAAALVVVVAIAVGVASGMRSGGGTAGRDRDSSPLIGLGQGSETPPAQGGAPGSAADGGDYVYADGSVYTGDMANGLPNGVGRITYPKNDPAGRSLYRGDVVDGQREGTGLLEWSDGDWIAGNWKDDELQGIGVYHFADGRELKGEWVHGSREGEFLLTMADGAQYSLLFEDDREVSRKELSSPSGPAATAVPMPAGTSGSGTGGPVLPDPALFLDCARYEDHATTYKGSDGWLVSCSVELYDGIDAAEEFRTLLESKGYKLTQDWHCIRDTSAVGSIHEDYFYTYGGSETVGSVVILSGSDLDQYVTSDVTLSLGRNYNEGRLLLTLYFGTGFTLEDSGRQATKCPEDLSGKSKESGGNSSGNSGGSASSGTNKGKVETLCFRCHGDKTIKCTQCDGKGFREKYISVPNYTGKGSTTKVLREDCFKCRGTGEITCTRCGGKGVW